MKKAKSDGDGAGGAMEIIVTVSADGKITKVVSWKKGWRLVKRDGRIAFAEDDRQADPP